MRPRYKIENKKPREYKPKLYIPGTRPMEIEWYSIKEIRENKRRFK